MNVTRNRALVDMLRNRVDPARFNKMVFFHEYDPPCASCTLGHALLDEGMHLIGFPSLEPYGSGSMTLLHAFGGEFGDAHKSAGTWFDWSEEQRYRCTIWVEETPSALADYIEAELLREALEEAQAMRNALPAVAEFA